MFCSGHVHLHKKIWDLRRLSLQNACVANKKHYQNQAVVYVQFERHTPLYKNGHRTSLKMIVISFRFTVWIDGEDDLTKAMSAWPPAWELNM